MDEKEFKRKYHYLRILKSVQDYLKTEGEQASMVYPIKVPDELVYQVVKVEGAEKADEVIHRIFRLGLTLWSEGLFQEIFGTVENLQAFIDLVKKDR